MVVGVADDYASCPVCPRQVCLSMSARPGFRSKRNRDRDDDDYDRPEPRLDQLRVPPHSVEAEQAVLGGLMLAPDAFDRVNDQLTENDFYRRDHRLIYRAIRELNQKIAHSTQ